MRGCVCIAGGVVATTPGHNRTISTTEVESWEQVVAVLGLIVGQQIPDSDKSQWPGIAERLKGCLPRKG